MRMLSLGLLGEGPTDRRFLEPLLFRAVERHIRQAGHYRVEIIERMHDLSKIVPDGSSSYTDRAVAALSGASQYVDLAFVHTDGGRQVGAARKERVAPFVRGCTEVEVVGVLPVYEMEAWAIADGDALRTALGVNLSDVDLGVPTDPESILDPKATLDNIARVPRRNRRKPIGGARHLAILGEHASLDCMDRLESFRTFDQSLQEALSNLGVIR